MLFFSFLLTFVQSKKYSANDYVFTNYAACPGQKHQYFAIKKFQVFHPLSMRGTALQVTLIAELSQKVQEPYIEIQFLNQRIPLLRKKDRLCRPGILICPASFSQLVYGVVLPVPSDIPFGEYKLRIIFREGIQKLSCYEMPLSIKPFAPPDQDNEEQADGYEYYD